MAESGKEAVLRAIKALAHASPKELTAELGGSKASLYVYADLKRNVRPSQEKLDRGANFFFDLAAHFNAVAAQLHATALTAPPVKRGRRPKHG